MTPEQAIAADLIYGLGRYSTDEVATFVGLHEADVERVVVTAREVRLGLPSSFAPRHVVNEAQP